MATLFDFVTGDILLIRERWVSVVVDMSSLNNMGYPTPGYIEGGKGLICLYDKQFHDNITFLVAGIYEWVLKDEYKLIGNIRDVLNDALVA